MTLPPAAAESARYFAAGNLSGDESFLLAVNQSQRDAVELELAFFFENREPLSLSAAIAPQSRKTFNAAQIFAQQQLPPQPFGVRIAAAADKPFFAELAVYGDAAGTHRKSGHADTGAGQLFSRCYFAEGVTTDGRNTLIAVLNPHPQELELKFSWFGTQSSSETLLQIPARRCRTLDARELAGTQEFAALLEATGTLGFFAEHVISAAEAQSGGGARNSAALWSHGVSGIPARAQRWYFAEGATHGNFETFLLLLNAEPESVTADLRFLLASGAPVIKRITLPPRQRTTVNVEQDFPEMKDQAGFATEIFAAGGGLLTAERAMYWRQPGEAVRSAGHAVAGVSELRPSWFFPEGAVWGDSDFETFFLINNPSHKTIDARVVFYRENREPLILNRSIAAFSRDTVKANDFLPPDQQRSTISFSTLVESAAGALILAERTMYWRGGDGTPRIEGHAATGIGLDPAIQWFRFSANIEWGSVGFKLGAFPSETFSIGFPEILFSKQESWAIKPIGSVGYDWQFAWRSAVGVWHDERSTLTLRVEFDPRAGEPLLNWEYVYENGSRGLRENLSAFNDFWLCDAPSFWDLPMERTFVLDANGQRTALKDVQKTQGPDTWPMQFYPLAGGINLHDIPGIAGYRVISPQFLSGDFIEVVSRDGRWSVRCIVDGPLAFFFNNFARTHGCVHAAPLFGDVATGQTATARGHVEFTRIGD